MVKEALCETVMILLRPQWWEGGSNKKFWRNFEAKGTASTKALGWEGSWYMAGMEWWAGQITWGHKPPRGPYDWTRPGPTVLERSVSCSVVAGGSPLEVLNKEVTCIDICIRNLTLAIVWWMHLVCFSVWRCSKNKGQSRQFKQKRNVVRNLRTLKEILRVK